MRTSFVFFAFLVMALVPFVTAQWCDEGTNQQILFNSLNGFYLNTETDTWDADYLWGSDECPCSWYGVDCGSNNNATTITLNLDGNGIYGSLNEDICSDIYSFINLSNNNFFGVLVDCITDLPTLRTLRLESNNFQGLLPAGAENLHSLDIRNNSFAGPLPTFISCPGASNSSVSVKYGDNDFWCPVDCSGEECEACAPEPSPACTSLNVIACDGSLACCYESTWDDACDDILDKQPTDFVCEEPPICEESSSDKLSTWQIIMICFAVLVVVAILFGIGWIGTCYVTFQKRQWSFKAIKDDLISEEDDNSLMEGLDEDLYYDGIPPRSSLDFEL